MAAGQKLSLRLSPLGLNATGNKISSQILEAVIEMPAALEQPLADFH
jgi:hypothetical protein